MQTLTIVDDPGHENLFWIGYNTHETQGLQNVFVARAKKQEENNRNNVEALTTIDWVKANKGAVIILEILRSEILQIVDCKRVDLALTALVLRLSDHVH